MAITGIYPIKSPSGIWRKSQQIITFDDKPPVRRCRAPHNPAWYVNELNAVNPVDIGFTETKLSTISYEARSKNIVSVGVSREKEKYKFIGLRPDKTQALGTEQIEFSLGEILVDGSPVKINVDNFVSIDPITTSVGNVVVRSGRQFTKIMARIRPIESFQLSFTLHITPGTLKIANKLDRGNYIPNENGEFIITDLDGNFKFKLAKPKLLNSNFEVLGNELNPPANRSTKHSLRYINGTDFQYVKESDTGCDFTDVEYVDGDIYYAATSDGYTYSWADTWATGYTTAYDVETALSNNDSGFGTARYNSDFFKYVVLRSFYMIDTSGVSDPASATFNSYGSGYDDSNCILMKGTQGATITTADHQAYTGTLYDTVAWDAAGWNVFTLNAQGISDINLSGVSYYCGREYNHDYLNATCGTNSYQNGCYFADNIGTMYDPYLDVVEVFSKISGKDWADIAKLGGVSKSGISKISGVGN